MQEDEDEDTSRHLMLNCTESSIRAGMSGHALLLEANKELFENYSVLKKSGCFGSMCRIFKIKEVLIFGLN